MKATTLRLALLPLLHAPTLSLVLPLVWPLSSNIHGANYFYSALLVFCSRLSYSCGSTGADAGRENQTLLLKGSIISDQIKQTVKLQI